MIQTTRQQLVAMYVKLMQQSNENEKLTMWPKIAGLYHFRRNFKKVKTKFKK